MQNLVSRQNQVNNSLEKSEKKNPTKKNCPHLRRLAEFKMGHYIQYSNSS